jgi:hypothetical protein
MEGKRDERRTLMLKMKILAACAIIAIAAFGTARADLINNGGGLIYDTAQNITWYDFQTNPMTFSQAQTWVAALSVAGVSDWTLPSAGPDPVLGSTLQSNYNVTTGQMGCLFYDDLGDVGLIAPNGSLSAPGTYGLLNTGPFENLTGGNHWAATEYTPGQEAWVFDMGAGGQNVLPEANTNSVAMAIHAGNIRPLGTSVPLPPALLLFGPSVAALAAIRRRLNH